MKKYISEYSIGLKISRCLIAFIILKKFIFYLPNAAEFFGIPGLVPIDGYLSIVPRILLLPYIPFQISFVPYLFCIVIAISAIVYFLDFNSLTRLISGIVAWLGMVTVYLRNPYILDGSDNVITVIFPLLLLAELSINFRGKWSWLKEYNNILNRIAIIGFKIQVCFVYFFTALAKEQGELWQNGTATYYTLRVEEFLSTNLNLILTENHYFVVLSTFATVFIEFAFAFLIWFRSSKYFMIVGMGLLHLSIYYFMRIADFSGVMVSTYFIFITNEEFKKFEMHYKSWFNKVEFHLPNIKSYILKLKKQ